MRGLDPRYDGIRSSEGMRGLDPGYEGISVRACRECHPCTVVGRVGILQARGTRPHGVAPADNLTHGRTRV